MKAGWQTKKLSDLFDITSSKRVFEADWKREGVPFYRAREIVKLAQQGFVDNELFISEEMFHRYAVKYGIPREGDIMVTGVGTLGICYVARKHDKFYFKDGNIIWLKKKNEVDSRFVEYAFKSDFLRKQIDDSVGATVGTFTIIKAKNTLIPAPSLQEQRRIVGILDEAFEDIATAKANVERNFQNARALFESYLQSVFIQHASTWESRPFEECIEGVKYTTKIQRKEFLEAGEYPIISQEADFINGYWDDVADVYEVASPIVIFGDHTKVLKFIDFDFVLGADGVKVLSPKKFLDPKFFFYSLRSVPLKSLGYSRHYRLLKELQINYPDMDQQGEAVRKLDILDTEVQRLKSIYRQKLAALDALKKSLLHQAFTGQL